MILNVPAVNTIWHDGTTARKVLALICGPEINVRFFDTNAGEEQTVTLAEWNALAEHVDCVLPPIISHGFAYIDRILNDENATSAQVNGAATVSARINEYRNLLAFTIEDPEQSTITPDRVIETALQLKFCTQYIKDLLDDYYQVTPGYIVTLPTDSNSFSQEDLAKLKPYLGNKVSFEDFAKLLIKVQLTVVGLEDGKIIVDSTSAFQ